MAKVLLLTATPAGTNDDYNFAAYRFLARSAELDRRHEHTVTEDPEAADVILFTEIFGAGAYFERVRGHRLVRRYREKCFLFCANDFVIPFLPGIYASIEKCWCSNRTISGFFAGAPENVFATYSPPRGSSLPLQFYWIA